MPSSTARNQFRTSGHFDLGLCKARSHALVAPFTALQEPFMLRSVLGLNSHSFGRAAGTSIAALATSWCLAAQVRRHIDLPIADRPDQPVWGSCK